MEGEFGLKVQLQKGGQDASDISGCGNTCLVFSGKMVSEGQEDFGGSAPTLSKWQVLRESQVKANQELKMKANELEKLFAEHKLRVSQSHDKNAATVPLTISTNTSKLSVTPQVKALDNQDDATVQKFSEFGLSDYCRGNLYESYMQKRDAKLREEWGSKKEEKEAKMKAMQDSFERSAAEMKAKLSSKRYEERSKLFNVRSTMATEEHPIGLLLSKDEEDLYFGNGGSKSSQAKKPTNKNLPSSLPTPSATSVLRSSTKTSNTSSGRRMLQPENALAHSVPNFSDLRKENPKPNSGVSKTVTRPPAKIHARSKSSIENIIVVKEERKPHCLQSLKKSAVVPTELGLVLTPTKCDKSDSFSQNAESKPLLRKGSRLGPGAGAVVATMKSSAESETVNSEVKLDALAFDPHVAENEDDEESETAKTEDHVNVDNVKPKFSHETEKLVDSGSEGGDALKSSSRMETSSVAVLPPSMPSTNHADGSVQNSPAESPVSWDSRAQHAFSYAHETSDIDASPIGSPASGNSGSLNQIEAGAARMRKKWGSTQKPNLLYNSSHGHSRKDVTGGFKRLLRFGRKSRGTDDSFNESEYFSEQVQALRSSIPKPPVNFKLKEHHLSGHSIKKYSPLIVYEHANANNGKYEHRPGEIASGCRETFRDHFVKLMGLFFIKFKSVNTHFEAELEAVSFGLFLTLRLGIPKIVVETNRLKMVQVLSSAGIQPEHIEKFAGRNEDANVALIGHTYLIRAMLSYGLSFTAYAAVTHMQESSQAVQLG
ncbi:hypothetical protein RHMOL_Rhmol12G0247600 [Rhododendron molle]|uniref:Uncharacterized protein n=1 Tax=Rhododendron molle TaxID=49168 RepID=A0ACC0LM74_RHOML|nr:hypothetical protein RHMOL_Rhmol12G0247600 [Rhododendron molle]